MSDRVKGQPHVSEQESMEVAEAAREKEWRQPSFLRELFLGRFRLSLIHPYPGRSHESQRPEFLEFYERFRAFLRDNVDSATIDATGEYPESVVQGLREIGRGNLCNLCRALGTHSGHLMKEVTHEPAKCSLILPSSADADPSSIAAAASSTPCPASFAVPCTSCSSRRSGCRSRISFSIAFSLFCHE